MNKKRIFQFSRLDDEHLEDQLKVSIIKLGADVDDSPFYSRRATHLIVRKPPSSEKCLGFIASGKRILSHEYISDSLEAGCFLPEDIFDVANVFPTSNFSKASARWKKAIDETKANMPFVNWSVACFISNDDKARAIMRLIVAGNGNAIQIKTANAAHNIEATFSLVIYSDELKSDAEKFARSKQLKCYPSLVIADHLLLGVPTSEPIMPLKYYQDFNTPNKLRSESLDPHVQLILAPLRAYLTDDAFHKLEFVDWSIECRFSNLWKNGGYVQALSFLNQAQPLRIVSSKAFESLLELLLSSKSEISRTIKMVNTNERSELERGVQQAYNMTHEYVRKSLACFSPWGQNTTFYADVFHSLSMDLRLKHLDKTCVGQFIDVLYIMCINDYILLNKTARKTKSIKGCALILNNIYSESKLRLLVEILLKAKLNEDVKIVTYQKLLQILAVCHENYEASRFCLNLFEAYFSPEALDSDASLASVFQKALSA